jgi:hypothetical protein
VGYVLNRDHWRQGLMTEVLTRMLEFAFEDLDLHRLEADIDNEIMPVFDCCRSWGLSVKGCSDNAGVFTGNGPIA